MSMYKAVDTTAPTFVGSFEPIFVNNKTFKGFFESSEPVTYTIDSTGSPAFASVGSETFARRHTIVIQDLVPADKDGSPHTYNALLTIEDRAGLTATTTFCFETTKECMSNSFRIGDAEWDETQTQETGDCANSDKALTLHARFLVEEVGTRNSIPVQGVGVIAQVVRRTVGPLGDLTPWSLDPTWNHPDGTWPTAFTITGNVDYELVNGIGGIGHAIWIEGDSTFEPDNPDKLLLSTVTESDGIATFDLELSDLACDEEIAIRVIGVVPLPDFSDDPLEPNYDPDGWPNTAQFAVEELKLAYWSLPDTDVELRQLERDVD